VARGLEYAFGMTTTAQTYRDLPLAERIELVEDIWDSIAQDTPALDLTDAHRDELRRRLDAHRADPSSSLVWESARAELLQRSV